MTTPPITRTTTNHSIGRQILYYFIGFTTTLSFLTTIFLFVPMMYYYLKPIGLDVNYISIEPVTARVGHPIQFKSTRQNLTAGTNVFSDTLICVDGFDNIILNEQFDSLRNVEASPVPKTVVWDFGFIPAKPYEKCRLISRVSRLRPFVGMVSKTMVTDWFAITN